MKAFQDGERRIGAGGAEPGDSESIGHRQMIAMQRSGVLVPLSYVMTSASTDGEPDDALVPAVVRGDEAAFRVLYRRHTPRLRGLVLRILGGNQADADDVVQESWLRAVAGLERFRRESKFGTWLIGIGVRVAWEAIRRRHTPVTFLPEHEPADDPPDTGERLDLEQALQRLPDHWRAVVVLHDVEGFGHDEIAATLGIAVGTSRSHLSRARKGASRDALFI